MMIEQLEDRRLMSASIDCTSDPVSLAESQSKERRLATSRQQLLATMVMMGTNTAPPATK